MLKATLICLGMGCVVAAVCWSGELFTASDFKIVDGTLYNIRRSKLWRDYNQLEVASVHADGLLAQSYGYREYRAPQANAGSATLGRVIRTEKTYGLFYFVRNCQRTNVVDRQTLWRISAMEVGTTNIDGATMKVLDCGLPNTEENRKTLKPK